MQSHVFENSRYGDTEIAELNGQLHLLQLFGMEMEVRNFQPARASGLADVFTSLGNSSFCRTLRRIDAQERTLRIELSLYGGSMEYTILLTHEPELGLIRRKDTLRNCSGQTVQLLRVRQRFPFADDDYEAYFQKSAWSSENSGAWYPVTPAGLSLGCEAGRTCEGHTPMLGLRSRDGRGVMIHLIPKGNWEMTLRLQSRQTQSQEFQYILQTGDAGEHFCAPLAPGAVYEAPELWLMSLSGGLLEMQANLQRYFLKTDERRFRIDPHPLAYNSWLDRFDHFDPEHIRKTVVSAKELGAEVFVLDAGWFGNCPTDPAPGGEDWFRQVGDWTEKENGAFRGNVRAFADFVRSQGLRFGLWIEPERIGRQTPIAQQHPAYFTEGNGFLYPRLWLPEVQTYLYDLLNGLIDRYGLEWIKIDFNHELEEDPSGWELHTYYDGWYSVLDRLRAAHPECLLEACASGGLRTDIRSGLSTDISFQSDNGNDIDSERFFEQMSLRFPAYKCQKWFAIKPGPPCFDYKTRTYTDSVCVPWHSGDFSHASESRNLDFISLLYISSNMALSGSFLELSAAQRETVKKYIALWKQHRALYRRAVLLLGREPGVACDRRGMQHLQYLAEAEGEGVVFIYKFDSPRADYLLRLRGLEPERRYRLTDAVSGEELGAFTGEVLMYRGLRIALGSSSFRARMIDYTACGGADGPS